MDEIINYRQLSEAEKDRCLSDLKQTSFGSHWELRSMKAEMDRSEEGSLPQFVFVCRDHRVIGYLFLIAEQEGTSRLFPWWAVDNSDELPPETDLRLLEYGIGLCRDAGCLKLAQMLEFQMENHRNGRSRRPYPMPPDGR